MNQTNEAAQDAAVERVLQKELIRAGALRQLRHNDGSPGFVFAYDVDITNRFLAALKAQPAPTETQGEDSARLDFIKKSAIKGATYKGITSANIIIYENEWNELGLRGALDAAMPRASPQPQEKP